MVFLGYACNIKSYCLYDIYKCVTYLPSAFLVDRVLKILIQNVCIKTGTRKAVHMPKISLSLTLPMPNFRRHLSSAFLFLTNYRLKRSYYVKLNY